VLTLLLHDAEPEVSRHAAERLAARPAAVVMVKTVERAEATHG
jgi:hypothetical protein